ncbi:MAG TPA: hypothetical protein VGE74_22735 [Gemmata sp.]
MPHTPPSAAPRARRPKPAGTPADVATSEVHYSADEVEFLNAVQAYQKRTGRKFPTLSELLAIVRALGYHKGPPEEGGK